MTDPQLRVTEEGHVYVQEAEIRAAVRKELDYFLRTYLYALLNAQREMLDAASGPGDSDAAQ